jgi:hypothetical protein
MTTLNDLIFDTRRHLYANQAPEANRLSANIMSSDTTMTMTYPVGSLSQQGAICSIDLEHIRVWSSGAGNTLTIERGVDGSTAAAHSANAYVEVMPKFSPFMIQRAVNNELDELASPWNGLFAVVDLEITYNPAVAGYDMTGVTPANVLAIQELRYKIPGPSKHLPAIRKFQIARTVPLADYPSGMALLLQESAFPGFPIHVRYRSRFTHLANLTDDVQSVGLLPAEANGIVPMGAAIELMAGREVKRNFTESTPDPLQLELVTGGQVLNSYKGLMIARQARIQAVAAGLIRQYGTPLKVI